MTIDEKKREIMLEKIGKMTKGTLDFIDWNDREKIFVIYLRSGKTKISDVSVDRLLVKYYYYLKKNRKYWFYGYKWD